MQQYFLVVTLVPSPLILSTGILKAISYKIRWEWGWPQKIFVGVVSLVGSGTAIILQNRIEPSGLPNVLTFVGFFYLYTVVTFPGSPEVTGSRQWPNFTQLESTKRVLALVEG